MAHLPSSNSTSIPSSIGSRDADLNWDDGQKEIEQGPGSDSVLHIVDANGNPRLRPKGGGGRGLPSDVMPPWPEGV